ncbi:hypothetical protein KC19_2G256200 [Ceratodon purpureus]|uniref:F-box domain-containing protein n=1 Tax=Ceratodon purpureus TaxID=3225 RepID=A0A8T0J0S0_CERPU|nr:hypothetical protein KC19_2G256200 [Ceratodon purpureus]
MGAMAEREATTVEVLSEGWVHQESLKAGPTSMDAVDGTNLPVADAIALEGVVEEQPPSMEETLPVHVISKIINKVKDARDLANCMATSKTLHESVQHVKSLSLLCRKRYYDLARERFPVRRPYCLFSDDDGDDETGSDDSDDSEEEEDDIMCEWSAITALRAEHGVGPPTNAISSSSKQLPVHVSFKNACLNMLRHVKKVEQLRIEVDMEMQANMFEKEEIHMVDFWLSEPMFVRKWVSLCSHTLRHLTVVDYGQQAIMRQSPIVRVLSETCKNLQHLELRNMYLDTNDLEVLPKVQSLTLRCIKMTDKSLTDINNAMPGLITLALVSVFGVQEARLSSQNLQVLCLGLSTSARTVDLDLPSCTKLQLKMTCPDSLRVHAPKLAYVAVCMEKRDNAVVEFDNVHNLKELLFGASHFQTLSKLMRTNPNLEKIFLDVPCMALGEDGNWEGVLDQIPRNLPDIEALKESCPVLQTLSVGPGLWHSMEEAFISNQQLALFRRWPALSKLIVHMVVQSLESCIAVLQCLVAAMPSLEWLEVYVHLDSPVPPQLFSAVCRERLLGVRTLQLGTWKRSLNFTCFSF